MSGRPFFRKAVSIAQPYPNDSSTARVGAGCDQGLFGRRSEWVDRFVIPGLRRAIPFREAAKFGALIRGHLARTVPIEVAVPAERVPLPVQAWQMDQRERQGAERYRPTDRPSPYPCRLDQCRQQHAANREFPWK